MNPPVPDLRIRILRDDPPDPGGEFVLYWMIGQRRLSWNFALDRAVAWAAEMQRPLVILEALRLDYPWASVRHHRFVLDGMGDHLEETRRAPVLYYPFVEHEAGAGEGRR